MSDMAQNENEQGQVPDLLDAVAQTTAELSSETEVAATEDQVELTPQQMQQMQQEQQEAMIKQILDSFDDEMETQYRDIINAYIDYLEKRKQETFEMLFTDRVIRDTSEEPIIDTENEAARACLEIQPALNVLAHFQKSPIYFNELQKRTERLLIAIQNQLASIHQMDPEAEEQHLQSVDGSLVYGVSSFFTLQANNVLKTLVTIKRQGKLDEENRDLYIGLLDKNFNTHKNYLASLESYQQAIMIIESHYDIIRNICLELPLDEKVTAEAAND